MCVVRIYERRWCDLFLFHSFHHFFDMYVVCLCARTLGRVRLHTYTICTLARALLRLYGYDGYSYSCHCYCYCWCLCCCCCGCIDLLSYYIDIIVYTHTNIVCVEYVYGVVCLFDANVTDWVSKLSHFGLIQNAKYVDIRVYICSVCHCDVWRVGVVAIIMIIISLLLLLLLYTCVSIFCVQFTYLFKLF